MGKTLFASAASAALAVLSGAVVAFVACDDETGSAPTNYAPLLHTLTESVVLPANSAFSARADDLAAAVAALQASATPDEAALGKVQAAWRAARAAFRNLDAVHFGPVTDLGITDRIDVAPASPGDIDAAVAASTPIDDNAVSVSGGKAKGFLGLEYLLFAKEGDPAVLAKLQGAGAPERRRALAKAMADEIASSAHQLADAWAAGKGGYAGQVENAGSGSARYPTQRAAVDDLIGGVGYALELVVGVRLALPLGLKAGGTPDPSQDPTTASDSAVPDLEATLGGIVAIYQGQGLSAEIRPKTAALDDRVNAQLADCKAKVTAIPAPFATSVASDAAVVTAAYDACKTLKATWNTDLTSAIGATLKPGDTDGD